MFRGMLRKTMFAVAMMVGLAACGSESQDYWFQPEDAKKDCGIVMKNNYRTDDEPIGRYCRDNTTKEDNE